jgi:predicted nucleic acid-binding protein
MIFVDANYFLRYLAAPTTERARQEQEQATELFTHVQRGEVEVTSSDAVIAEVAFVLAAKSHYGLSASEVSARLKPLLRLSGFRMPTKRQCLRALDVWVTYPALGFVDALAVSYAEQQDFQLATFDSHFNRVADIQRWQPSGVKESGAEDPT